MDSDPVKPDQEQKQQKQEQPQQREQQQLTPVFFALSVKKLTVMSVATFGLYEIWWFFKNWLYIDQSLGRKVSPGWRAWFCIIFNYALFKEIREFGKQKGITASLPAGLLATAWIILHLLGRFSEFGICVLLSYFSFVPLIIVQRYINRINLELNPNCEFNSKFTKGNWVAIVIGGCLVVLTVIATIKGL